MRRIAVYPGSFDPPTLGHMDVIERAARLFDEIVVAVGINILKEPFLSPDLRLTVLTDLVASLPNVQVEQFEGLLADYARKKGASAIVRGLRATADFEYEFQMAMVNRRLQGDIETVFLMTGWEFSYVSSSMVREVALLGGDYGQFVPPAVAKVIESVLAVQR